MSWLLVACWLETGCLMDDVELQRTDGLAAELQELDRALAQRRQTSGNAAARRRIAQGIGAISALRHLSGEEIRSLFGDAPLVGVDGSMGSCGASFPYTVTLFRALARSTAAGAAGARHWTYRVFSPLLPGHQARVQELLDQGLGPEAALAHIRWSTLAAMEAEAGQAALEREHPRMLLWDGGFARLEEYAPETWERLQESALRQGTVMLGVTEEIATRILADKVPEAAGPEESQYQRAGRPADREWLYGMLQPGEIFQLNGAPAVGPGAGKRGRVYARLAAHPQAIAVDYLTAQSGELETALNFLYTITPSRGRGFPLWLDVVDADVRITGDQLEALLTAHLDPALRELFLRPLRARREL